MSAKFKAVTVIVGGALTTLAIPAAGAQAAGNPGLTAPHPKSASTNLGSAAHPKAATPSAACGGITWQDNYDNKYLEIYHSGTAHGDWADAHAGNGTCTQHWFAVTSGSLEFFNPYHPTAEYGMVNTNSEKCLAAPNTNIGNTHVRQESCGFSQYNYRWQEFSDSGTDIKGGFVLVETIMNGQQLSNGTKHPFVAACEDVASANHWIYTSYWYNATGTVHNTPAPSNCVWH